MSGNLHALKDEHKQQHSTLNHSNDLNDLNSNNDPNSKGMEEDLTKFTPPPGCGCLSPSLHAACGTSSKSLPEVIDLTLSPESRPQDRRATVNSGGSRASVGTLITSNELQGCSVASPFVSSNLPSGERPALSSSSPLKDPSNNSERQDLTGARTLQREEEEGMERRSSEYSMGYSGQSIPTPKDRNDECILHASTENSEDHDCFAQTVKRINNPSPESATFAVQPQLACQTPEDLYRHERPEVSSRTTTSEAPSETGDTVSTGEDSDQLSLSAYGQQLRKVRCATCNEAPLFDNKGFMKKKKELLHDDKHKVDSTFQCVKCGTNTCMGCGNLRSPVLSSSLSGTEMSDQQLIQPENLPPVWCCHRGCLFLLWAFLCTGDQRQKSKMARKFELAKKLDSHPDQSPTNDHRKGTGYGIETDTYASPGLVKSSTTSSVSAARYAEIMQLVEDRGLEASFRNLAALLPSFKMVDRDDCETPSLLLAMVKRSPMLERTAELLRNESAIDITKRKALYRSLFDFTERLAKHDATAAAVQEQRMIFSKESGILSVSLGLTKHNLRSRPSSNDETETTESIASIVTNLQVSSRKMLEQAKTQVEEFSDSNSQDMLSLCQRVCDLSDCLQASSPSQKHASQQFRGKGKAPITNEASMTQWHRKHCVEEVDDDIMKACFSEDLPIQSKLGPRKGRMKRLITELATMQTALPEGIYVRHGASRLDVMKVMIVGPRDTPYEHGLFEFDLFCPWNYPQVPPKMLFRIADHGEAHFNPNLYSDGKVCLSLLGTWEGDPWLPDQSTLLQVLVSIQGMIFCEDPWYNEPGREAPNDLYSNQYNVYIQSLVVPHALQYWLTKSSPIWKMVVEKHFSIKGAAILATLKEWSRKALVTATQPLPNVHAFDDDGGDEFYDNWPSAPAELIYSIEDFERTYSESRNNNVKRKEPETPFEDSLRSLEQPWAGSVE